MALVRDVEGDCQGAVQCLPGGKGGVAGIVVMSLRRIAPAQAASTQAHDRAGQPLLMGDTAARDRYYLHPSAAGTQAVLVVSVAAEEFRPRVTDFEDDAPVHQQSRPVGQVDREGLVTIAQHGFHWNRPVPPARPAKAAAGRNL